MTCTSKTASHQHNSNVRVDSDTYCVPSAGPLQQAGRKTIDVDRTLALPESSPAGADNWNDPECSDRKTSAPEKRNEVLNKLKSLVEKSATHTPSSTPAKYVWSMAVLLLYRLFNELKTSNLNRFGESLDRTMELLDQMLGHMGTQINQQQEAANVQNAIDLVFNIAQVAVQVGTLVKSASLVTEKKALTDSPKNVNQIDQAATELDANAAKAGDLINRVENSTNSADSSTQNTIKSLKATAADVIDDAATAGENVSAIKATLPAAVQKRVDDIEGLEKRVHMMHQMTNSISGIGHAIGGLAAAPTTAKSQTAGKEKEATDTGMQVEASKRGLLNEYVSAFNQTMNNGMNAFQQGIAAEAEASKAAARAA